MKYKRLTNSIDSDYRNYLGKEGIYQILFGQKVSRAERQKSNYIWKSLLKQF